MGKSNNADVYQIQYNMFYITGVWPLEKTSFFYNFRCLLFTWLFCGCLWLVLILELISDIKDFIKLSETLYIMVTILTGLLKVAGFMYNRKTFIKLLDFLKNPIFLLYPDDLDCYVKEAIKNSNRLANTFRYTCLSCVVLFAIYPLFDEKPLPFPFPYDLGKYAPIMYFVQTFGVASSAWNNSTVDTLTCSLIILATAYLDILKEKIIRIGEEAEETNKQQTAEKLKECVQHHLAIIRLITLIDSTFTIGLLIQFSGSILVVCNTLFLYVLVPVTSSQFFSLTNYIACMLIQLTMYCWFGNEVLLKSVDIANACYMSKWYNYDAKVSKYIFIIMERSKRPLTIKAYKFSKLSLNALMTILQWSYSYLALLLKLYSKQSD